LLDPAESVRGILSDTCMDVTDRVGTGGISFLAVFADGFCPQGAERRRAMLDASEG